MKMVNKFFDNAFDDAMSVTDRMEKGKSNYWSNKMASTKKDAVVFSIYSASVFPEKEQELSTDNIIYGLPIRAVME